MTALSDMTDEELVGYVREHDQEAYGEVIARYQHRLIRYATSIVKNRDQALDVVQESFIKAFQNLNGFNTNKKFSSWIYRIVHNEALNSLKKHRREISLEENEWVANTVASGHSVAEDAERAEVVTMMHTALAELPLHYREPLVLFFLDDQSYETIAEVLHLPLGTVGTRINRGKKLLKEAYQAL